MKLQILSDLHLELNDAWTPRQVDADVVILAGDIQSHTRGIEWARQVFGRERGLPVIYVAGNHEFYGAELHGLRKEMRLAAVRAGVFYLDDDEIEIQGVRFLGATLWTDFKLFGAGEAYGRALREARRYMNDFTAIRAAPLPEFRPEDSVRLHERSRAWLRGRLEAPYEGKTVVVTHHAPSIASIAPRFKDDLVSAAFASDLTGLVGLADLWVHGHTHAFCDYELDGCRVVCNPRGYVQRDGFDRRVAAEKTGFVPDLVVEV
jgi:predicted phosphodiesterase